MSHEKHHSRFNWQIEWNLFRDLYHHQRTLNHDSCKECTQIFFVNEAFTFPVMRGEFSHGYVVLMENQ